MSARGSYGVTRLFDAVGPARVVLVWSMWGGYWERNERMRAWSDRSGIEPQFVHSGGHAWPEDLERLVGAIGAKETIWVHTDSPVAFSTELRTFVDEQLWTFAKTMAQWPHEYIVRDRVDQRLFEGLVRHIRAHGREGRFYERVLIYYEEAGMVYWTMGAPLHETTIVNWCDETQTYEARLAAGTLPNEARR